MFCCDSRHWWTASRTTRAGWSMEYSTWVGTAYPYGVWSGGVYSLPSPPCGTTRPPRGCSVSPGIRDGSDVFNAKCPVLLHLQYSPIISQSILCFFYDILYEIHSLNFHYSSTKRVKDLSLPWGIVFLKPWEIFVTFNILQSFLSHASFLVCSNIVYIYLISILFFVHVKDFYDDKNGKSLW